MTIIDLFRKTITSLSCIERIITNEKLKDKISLLLDDLTTQYSKYISNKDMFKIEFKYSDKEVNDIFYECVETTEDIVYLSEEMYYGFSELNKTILKERETKK